LFLATVILCWELFIRIVWERGSNRILLKICFFFLFLHCFDVLMSKIILKNKKYIALIHFQAKNTLNLTATKFPNTIFIFLEGVDYENT
jgi:hypothetical protein